MQINLVNVNTMLLLHDSAVCTGLTMASDPTLGALQLAVFMQTVRYILIGKVQGNQHGSVLAPWLHGVFCTLSLLGTCMLLQTEWQSPTKAQWCGNDYDSQQVNFGRSQSLAQILLSRLGQTADHVHYFSGFLFIYNSYLSLRSQGLKDGFISFQPIYLLKPFIMLTACNGCHSYISKKVSLLSQLAPTSSMPYYIHSSGLNVAHFRPEEVLPLQGWKESNLVAGLFFLSMHGSCARLLENSNIRHSWRTDWWSAWRWDC